ncbi:MAG: PilZ domain-containing protein [Spirochaetales bacterium]|nr:MAG: PilZ domain-containing protein [Spirochaetales bacterium]
MKALLIVENDDIAKLAGFYLKPLGFDVIRYRDPLKALDNLEEIDPDAVIMSARDFPRHWKSIVVNIRSFHEKTDCIVIILKGEFFPFEEAAKAAHLGVNGVVREDFADRSELGRFQKILKRYIEVDEARISDRQQPDEWDRLDFTFGHPRTLALVSGRIETISATGLSFLADFPALVADLEPGDMIEDGSLRVDRDIVPCPCVVVRNGAVMAFKFDSMESKDLAELEQYLKSRTERQITGLLKK